MIRFKADRPSMWVTVVTNGDAEALVKGRDNPGLGMPLSIAQMSWEAYDECLPSVLSMSIRPVL